MSVTSVTGAPVATAALSEAVYRDGIAGLPGLFPREWAEQLRQDFVAAFAHALSYEQGTIGRGPNRHYFAVHPQQIAGFVDLVTAPAITDLCAAMLGPDYKIVELGFDVPLPGALNQPWHRDFAAPPETTGEGRLTSLAFNVTTVDVTPDMGPFEVAPGTHWDSGADFAHEMFPQQAGQLARYDALGSRRMPRQGDVSVRTGLTIHRGTANVSERERAVLILGATTRNTKTDVHELHVTQAYFDALPEVARTHLACTIVDELRPIVQTHDIEGLMMGG
ncbi:MAG: phytanoyl-CoA dioxygenase family protein [Actinomycetota bacterium]|nr:phytanoyl-CoA dioxygenase family protein [Actinomycetota bacterium]